MLKKPSKLQTVLFFTFLICALVFGSSRGVYELPMSFTFVAFYIFFMTHICISAMSLSFHRNHTHKGVDLKPIIDYPMQIVLWMVTGMNKSDWVSVHLYHHAHSDQEKDPHSPVQKGLMHVLFLGVFDYTKAKNSDEVQAIAKRLKMSNFECFIRDRSNWGLALMSVINVLLFGWTNGMILNIMNYSISPIFAVGGVNALAHWFGYRNHKSGDNSRNLGFVFPLNFMICGELDHNNHHGHQKSCSFRHKWYEFDIGYVYIKLFSYVGLAKIKNVYTPVKMKETLAQRVLAMIDKDHEIQARLELLCKELDMTATEIKEHISAYIEGKKRNLARPILEFKREVISLVHLSYRTDMPAMA